MSDLALGVGSFLEGLADSGFADRDTSIAGLAKERDEHLQSPEGKAQTQRERRANADSDEYRRLARNKSINKEIAGNIIAHPKIKGDEKLTMDLSNHLETLSSDQMKNVYDAISEKGFGGYTFVGKNDQKHYDAAKVGDMNIAFGNQYGDWFMHTPNGQAAKATIAMKNIGAGIASAKTALLKIDENMDVKVLNQRAYTIALKSATPIDRRRYLEFNTTFANSIDTLVNSRDRQYLFVTPDSYASQVRKVAERTADVAASNTYENNRRLTAAQEKLAILQKGEKGRGVYAPRQYAVAMRELFSARMASFGIFNTGNQQAYMKTQLNNPEEANNLFKILSRLYGGAQETQESQESQGNTGTAVGTGDPRTDRKPVKINNRLK